MKFFISILLLFSGISINAQRLKTEFLLSKADSLLFANVDENLYPFAHFNFNQGSYYEYSAGNNKIRIGSLKPNGKTKGTFIKAHIRYVFNLPIKGANGAVFVSFNNKFELIDKWNLDFMPDFLLEEKPFNFISVIQAAEIGLDSLKHRGLILKGPFLKYSNTYKRYVYEIIDTISEGVTVFGHPSGNWEVIIIDAITGHIIYHKTEDYGWLIIR